MKKFSWHWRITQNKFKIIMVSLNITITQGKTANKKMVEFDVGQLERLAAALNMFNPDFLKSIARAEKDIKAGRVREVKSLKELRKK